jgi:hypothetical protein
MQSLPDNKDGEPLVRRPESYSRLMRYIIGALIGGLAGFGYYKLVGCSTGTCPLTSNPWSSTIYGMVMGCMIAGTSG